MSAAQPAVATDESRGLRPRDSQLNARLVGQTASDPSDCQLPVTRLSAERAGSKHAEDVRKSVLTRYGRAG